MTPTSPPAPARPGRSAHEPGAAPEGFLPLCVPHFRGNEWTYLKECIDTGWVSSVGAFVDRFERAVAARAGARHAVAVVNGTSALHLALLVAGLSRTMKCWFRT